MQELDTINFGLKSLALEQISGIFRRHSEVEKVILYGSRAKGNYKPYSDIDVTLVGSKIDLTLQNKIENELDDLLLPYKFDVSVFHKIKNKDLIEHIQRVGKNLFSR
jgi:predicted nucleotidyltransferase